MPKPNSSRKVPRGMTQAEKTASSSRNRKEQLHQQFSHMLHSIQEHPPLYRRPEFQYLRDFVDLVSSNRVIFPEIVGDNHLQLSSVVKNGEVSISPPTKGLVQSLAKNTDLTIIDRDFDGRPILQVLSRETMYRQPAFKGPSFGKMKHQVPIQFTHVRFLDGDNNQFLGRFVVHLTAESRKLKTGDIIRLESYTKMTHCVEEETPKPAVFIAKFSVIGYNAIPDLDTINDPLTCTISPVGHGSIQGKGPIGTDAMPCETGKCGCSMYCVSFVSCICITNPVDRLNLKTVKEDCYFADKELDQMTECEKRCMIYWWDATNIYLICGKNKCLQLPV